jgi:TetR/AcrR family transcriptional regulator, cholesterol catabolism regulator
MLKRKNSGKAAKSDIRGVWSGTDSQDRWQQILDVSGELFRQKGYSGTSMNDISKAVGLLKGSLYYYIRSKEDLLFEILKGLHDDGEEIVASVKFGSNDSIGQLQLYLMKAIVFAGRNAKRMSIFLRDFEHVPVARRGAIISEREMYVLTATRLIEEGVKRRIIAPSLEPRMAATLIMGAVSSTHEWLRPDGKQPIEEIAASIAHMLTEGLGGPHGMRKADTAAAGRHKSAQVTRTGFPANKRATTRARSAK